MHSAELNLEWTDGARADRRPHLRQARSTSASSSRAARQGATLLTTIVTLDPIHFVFEVSETDYLRYTRLFLSGDAPSSREIANPVRIRLADEKDLDAQRPDGFRRQPR